MALWPVVLRGTTPKGVEIELGPLQRRDAREWLQLRRRNRAWLTEWEATAPDGTPNAVRFPVLVRHYNREGRDGRMLPFAIRCEGRLVGQLHLFGISGGSLQSAAAGYWVDERMAGRGVIPTALALAGDHAFAELRLHRIEVNIRPENANSLAVVRKLGFRDEGVRLSYLHINGAWRDHRTFALTVEDLSDTTLMQRLHSDHISHIGDTPPQVRSRGASGT